MCKGRITDKRQAEKLTFKSLRHTSETEASPNLTLSLQGVDKPRCCKACETYFIFEPLPLIMGMPLIPGITSRVFHFRSAYMVCNSCRRSSRTISHSPSWLGARFVTDLEQSSRAEYLTDHDIYLDLCRPNTFADAQIANSNQNQATFLRYVVMLSAHRVTGPFRTLPSWSEY